MKAVFATYRCVKVERDPPDARLLGVAAYVELVAKANPPHASNGAFGRMFHMVFNPQAADEFREGEEYELTFRRIEGAQAPAQT